MPDADGPVLAAHAAAHAAVVALLQAAARVRRALAAAVEPSGVTLQQYNVLRILRGAAPEPVATYTIAERLVEQTPGITRLLDRLDEKGLVHRVRCGADRRQVLCTLTDAGRALVQALDAPTRAVDTGALGALTPAQVRALAALVRQVASE